MPLTGYPSLCGERQPIIVSRDRGQSREHRAQNPGGRRVSHYQIDGVVIRDSALHCDFLLMNDEKADAYLIELKGSDIEHALEQLEATARRLQSELRGYTVKYRLVHSRAKTQAIHSNAIKKFCRAHAKKGEFLHQEGRLTEII